MNIEIPKVTKPWSKEMYEWNDFVATLMKGEIKVQIENSYKNNDYDKLNQLITLCGGIKYGDGFSIDDLYEGCLNEVEMVQNYWLNEEWNYAVKEGIVSDCVEINFVGY
tara:strand:+ start:345 stop:671 length:327 start_codon:yes stop_codon:yes gene_type:complete